MVFPIHICAVGLRGANFLAGLVARGVRVSAISYYLQPDDQSASHLAIAKIAAEIDVPVRTTRHPDFPKEGLTFVVGWQYLFYECPTNVIVFHDSLLPRYRGFAPTVTALLNGDSVIGVTALRPSSKVDAGPIFAQQRITIVYPAKIEHVLRQQSAAMVELAHNLVQQARNGALSTIDQDESRASYSLWRDELDYRIDWTQSSSQIKRMIDAVGYPYGGAKTRVGDREILVEDASVVDDLTYERRDAGKVWRLENGCPVIVCGTGMLRLDRFQFCTGNDSSLKLRSRFQ